VYVLHPRSRFEVANYRTVPIPTNVDVADEIRKNFPGFYAELFDATLRHYGGRAVVTEYAWGTSSCDRCPTPPLAPAELSALGGDVMQEVGISSSYVLTRLHTRYDKQTLSDDLVFREAAPLEGGRDWIDTRTNPGAPNNFQARYIIRHYWSGPVKCEAPIWGRWGGPPSGREQQPMAATGLANAPRGKIELAKVVRSPLPELGLPGQTPPHKGGRR